MFDVTGSAGYSLTIKSTDVKSLTADLDKVFGPRSGSPRRHRAGHPDRAHERARGRHHAGALPRDGQDWIDRIDQIDSTSGARGSSSTR
jgi:hypothetical protein